MSDISLLETSTVVRLLRPLRGSMSVMVLAPSPRLLSLSRHASGEMSETLWPWRSSSVRFAACSRPDRLTTRPLSGLACTSSDVSSAISAAVTAEPGALLSVALIAARSMSSATATAPSGVLGVGHTTGDDAAAVGLVAGLAAPLAGLSLWGDAPSRSGETGPGRAARRWSGCSSGHAKGSWMHSGRAPRQIRGSAASSHSGGGSDGAAAGSSDCCAARRGARSQSGSGRAMVTLYRADIVPRALLVTVSVTVSDAAGSRLGDRAPQQTALLSVLIPHECS